MPDEHGPDIPEGERRDTIRGIGRRKVAAPESGLSETSQSKIFATVDGSRESRLYLPTLADLIDRLTICQLKAIFIQDHRSDYLTERALIEHDIDILLSEPERAPLTALDVRAIIIVMLANRCIWESESKARGGGDDQDHLLKFTHSVNGIRNAAKNVLSRSQGERLDWKVDCFAESLIAEFGNWQVFES